MAQSIKEPSRIDTYVRGYENYRISLELSWGIFYPNHLWLGHHSWFVQLQKAKHQRGLYRIYWAAFEEQFLKFKDQIH